MTTDELSPGAVRDTDETPYCVSSPDPGLTQLLSSEWPHQDVLGQLP